MPFIVVGVGGALVIAGAVVWIAGKIKENDAGDRCPVRDQCSFPDVVNDGESARHQETLGGVLAGVGGAAVAGGLIWHFVAAPSSSSPATTASQRATVSPLLGPSFAGFSLAGRF